MEGRLTTVVAAVLVNAGRSIDLSGDIQQEVNQMVFRQMIFRKPVSRRRREQAARIRLPFAKLTIHLETRSTNKKECPVN